MTAEDQSTKFGRPLRVRIRIESISSSRSSGFTMQCFIPPLVPVRTDLCSPRINAFRGQRLISSRPFPQGCDQRGFAPIHETPQAKQSTIDPKSENPLFDDSDASNPPKDFATELEATLQQLGEKMSQLPVPSREEATAKGSLQGRENAYEQVLRTATKRINNIPDEPEEEWTSEQRALYTLVKQYDDNSSDEIESSDLSFPPSEPPVDLVVTSSSRRSQTDPRKIDRDIQSKLQTLQKRRRRLASERGENDFKQRRSLVPEKDSDNELEFLQQHDRENMKNHVLFSIRGARIINFSERISEPCALTAGAKHHFYEVWRVPFMYRPFLGVQDAFQRLDNPPCPRCGRSMPRSPLKHGTSICHDCYSRIYLQTPVGSETSDPSLGYGPWISKELKQEESRMADAAERIALSLSGNLLAPGQPVMTSPEEGPQWSDTIESSGEKAASSKQDTKVVLKAGSGADMNGTGGPPKRRRRSQGDRWNVQASDRSLRTINPIRNLVQNIDVVPNPNKEVIRLSVGDPTVYGNLSVSEKAIDKFCEVIRSGKANGYSMSMGGDMARQAVAEKYSSEQSPLGKDDVILTAGTSGALELALGAIANEGDNVLLPSPGFPLFRTIAEGYGIECRFYEVDPNNNWEIKLGDLTTLADDRTRAIVVNNPSNPCGSVYSASHIEDLLAVASVLKLPIIADEVYADMVFSDQKFTSIGAASVDVPVLSVGGVSKQFVVPGWRLGWVLIHDRKKVFEKGEVRKGMRQLTTRMLVPNTPAQHVLPTMLQLGMGTLMKDLEANAEFTVRSLESAKGLRVIRPQGAMYAMVEIDAEKLGVEDDMDFVRQLLAEESVFVLPGQCFQATNFVRIVFSAPKDILAEAFSRMKEFCERRCP